MKIDKIICHRNKTLLVYNGKEYEFSKDIIYKENLFEEKEIPPKEFFEIKQKSDCLLAQNYLFRLLSTRLKSQKEAEIKLREKGFFSSAIKLAIDKAKEYRLLDDDNYARAYVNTHLKNKGSKLIRYELVGKGISEHTIDKYLEDTWEFEKQRAMEHASKYLKAKGEKATKEKLYRRLYSKGYSNDLIMEVLSNIFE